MEASVLWRTVFGNDRPVEIEIGPGRGDVLAAFAARHPERSFLGIERGPGLAEMVEARIRAEGLANVRVLAGDARCIVATILPARAVAAYHIYFPDPWPKTRHRERRLFLDATFAPQLARTLVPDGRVHVATDLPHLFDAMGAGLERAGFTRSNEPAPSRPTTKFERKYGGAGTWAGTWVPPR